MFLNTLYTCHRDLTLVFKMLFKNSNSKHFQCMLLMLKDNTICQSLFVYFITFGLQSMRLIAIRSMSIFVFQKSSAVDNITDTLRYCQDSTKSLKNPRKVQVLIPIYKREFELALLKVCSQAV